MSDGERVAPGAGAPTSVGEWIQVALAWAVVGIPTVWGVAQVVAKSAALFHGAK